MHIRGQLTVPVSAPGLIYMQQSSGDTKDALQARQVKMDGTFPWQQFSLQFSLAFILHALFGTQQNCTACSTGHAAVCVHRPGTTVFPWSGRPSTATPLSPIFPWHMRRPFMATPLSPIFIWLVCGRMISLPHKIPIGPLTSGLGLHCLWQRRYRQFCVQSLRHALTEQWR